MVTLAKIRADAEAAIDLLTDYQVRDTDACVKAANNLLGDDKFVGLREKIRETDEALPELASEAIEARGTDEPGDTPAILTLGEIANEVLKVGNTLAAKPHNRAKRTEMARYLEDFIRDIDATSEACPEWDEYIRESEGETSGGVLGSKNRWTGGNLRQDLKTAAKMVMDATRGPFEPADDFDAVRFAERVQDASLSTGDGETA